jgi:hypothetical protein
MGADKAIITDLRNYDSAWCTKNTSGTAKIKVSYLKNICVLYVPIFML